MKLTKRVISVVLTLIMILTVMSVGIVGSSAATNKYSDAAMALDDEYAYDGELGAIYSPESTTFKVWSPNASKVVLNLYTTGSNGEEGAAKISSTDMEKEMDGDAFTGVWALTVEGDQKNVYYTYSVTRPDSILGGTEKTIETQDIYSKAVGVNGNRSMVVDLDSTDPEGWDDDAHVYVENQTDASVWEVHVKDFSYSESSGVSEANRGKYLAFTELGTTLNDEGDVATCVDYLKELGITHVQINPFYDFATVNEALDDSQFNWGYDPKNYGVPEGSYSSNPYDGNVRITECKQMIQALHEAGIGVIMDVVYNHTYSIDSSFTACVPQYYYRLAASGSYSNQSGCGNDTASERAMYRKYMREMLLYWTNEYHIDGYRFDLMGVHDAETMNLIREDMDSVDPRILMFGEGWSGATVFDPQSCTGETVVGATQLNAKKYVNTRIGFFNDVIRDGIKGGVFDGATTGGFVNGVFINSPKICCGIRAQSFNKNQNWTAAQPTQTVTYASCHDNNTLYDKLVAINKGLTVDYRARYSDVISQNKFTSAIIQSSQGINFLLAGEEMGRSKDGDENSYKSPADENMIDWNLLVQNADLVSYYKGMFELRKAFSPFTAAVRDEEDDSYQYNWTNSTSNATRYIAYTVDNTAEGEWSKIAVILNSQAKEVSVTLKDASVTDDTEWVIVANNEGAGVTQLDTNKGKTFTVAPQSAVIAVEKTTFDEVNVQTDYSSVLVQNILEDTGEVYSQYYLKGKTGEPYYAQYDSVPLKYDYDRSEGETEGVFADEEKVVKFYFNVFTPEVFKAPAGDINGDGEVDLIDASLLQRGLAELEKLDDEQISKGDYNLDGETDISDVTFLAQYLSGYDVAGIKTVTVNHYDNSTGKSISSSTVEEYRFGDEYVTEPAGVTYYSPVEIPDNAEGVVNSDIVVNYYYEYKEKTVTLHVKHEDDSVTWTPYLWAWIHDSQTAQDTPVYASWPGLKMTQGESGWYETTLTVPDSGGFCCIISNNGSPQTKDYTGLNYDTDCYIVINDSKIVNQGDWLTFYSYNPETEN